MGRICGHRQEIIKVNAYDGTWVGDSEEGHRRCNPARCSVWCVIHKRGRSLDSAHVHLMTFIDSTSCVRDQGHGDLSAGPDPLRTMVMRGMRTLYLYFSGVYSDHRVVASRMRLGTIARI